MNSDRHLPDDTELEEDSLGFRLRASLTSYWAIPAVIFAMLFTSVTVYFSFFADTATDSNLEQTAAFVILHIASAILWWFALLRIQGHNTILLDQSTLECQVGIGPLLMRHRFQRDAVAKIERAEGVIGPRRGEAMYMAVVITFNRNVRWNPLRTNTFAFGHFLTPQQQAFIVSILSKHLRTAA